MVKSVNLEREDWVVYDFLYEENYPPNAGTYTVIVDGSRQQAYFYGGGWWDSQYAELDGDVSVHQWLRGSLVVEMPERVWINISKDPVKAGEYEVLIDAPWPLGGIGNAIWTGEEWRNSSGGAVKITKWR